MATEFPDIERLVALMEADTIAHQTSTIEILWQIASSEPLLVLIGMLATVGTTVAIHEFNHRRARSAEAVELYEVVKSIVHDIRYLTARYHAVCRSNQPPTWGFGPVNIFKCMPILTGFPDIPPRPSPRCYNLLSEAGAPELTARILTLHRCTERICAVMRQVEHFSNAADTASNAKRCNSLDSQASNLSRQAYTRLCSWGPAAESLALEFNELMAKKYQLFGLKSPLLIADDEGRDTADQILTGGDTAGDQLPFKYSRYYQPYDYKDEMDMF